MKREKNDTVAIYIDILYAFRFVKITVQRQRAQGVISSHDFCLDEQLFYCN